MQHDPYDEAAAGPRPGPPPGRGARGRHRKPPGGPRRDRTGLAGGAPFRTAVTAAGVLAATLTVAAGVYLAARGTPAGADTAPEAADAPLPVATVPAGTTGAAPAVADTSPGSGSAQPVTRVAARSAAQYIDQVLSLANSERRKAGCDPLRSDGKLRKAAQRHADDMSDREYYAHNSPEGRTPGERITAAGYDWSTWGENIFRGPHTAAEAVQGWMKSEGHRKNILNCAFKEVGVGVSLADNGPWWVQDFASP
ncbi:CAP domain-containing protein [Streptomyces sp. NPDC048659]|uniref:CAP domain-containing protein n=1 Tax=Streptomyces sp. NPDC048659 TaxID=3155489 RepID=UPI00341272BC